MKSTEKIGRYSRSHLRTPYWKFRESFALRRKGFTYKKIAEYFGFGTRHASVYVERGRKLHLLESGLGRCIDDIEDIFNRRSGEDSDRNLLRLIRESGVDKMEFYGGYGKVL